MLYSIIKLGNGWYDFKNIPQGYIKIHGLNCGSDKKAMRYGWKLIDRAGLEKTEQALCFEEVK